jgi:hypothetical protein
MKKSTRQSSLSRLSAYSAMAAAFMAGGNEAVAEIIYNDFDDVTIEIGDVFELDIDGDGIDDFHFRANSITGTAGTWSFASIFGSYTTLGIGGPSNQVMAYSGPYYYYGSFLESGDPVSSGADWPASASSIVVIGSNFYGVSYGAFPGQGDGYLGVRFSIDGNIHYGWIRLSAELDPVTVTIKDAAYENTAETAIDAGATESVSVLEFTSGAVQIYSLETSIQISTSGVNNTQASIYDLKGSLVYSGTLQEGSNKISTIHLSAGNYIVKVEGENTRITKQVFVN